VQSSSGVCTFPNHEPVLGLGATQRYRIGLRTSLRSSICSTRRPHPGAACALPHNRCKHDPLCLPTMGCSCIASGLQAVCDNTAIPNPWCCSSGNNPAPIPQPRLATPCVPVSFQLLVLMMTTKVVLLRGSACAFPVCAGTWPRDLRVPQSRLTRAEPRQRRLPGLGMPS